MLFEKFRTPHLQVVTTFKMISFNLILDRGHVVQTATGNHTFGWHAIK